MAGPFDYTIQAPNVGDEIAKGVQFGAALFDRNQKLELEQQQRAAQAQAAQQANEEMARFMSIPLDRVTSQDIFRVSQFMPVERLKESRDLFAAMPKEVQQREMSVGTQAMSALLSGRPDIAAGTLRTRAEGARNSGDEQKAKGLEVMADAVEKNPDFGFKALSSHIAGLPGGKEAIEAIITAGKGPSEIKKAEAGADQARSDADIAAVKSKFAESKAVGELKLNDAQIKAMAADTDIKRINANAAMISAAAQREMNPLKRQELDLRLQEMAQKRDDLVREKTGKVESARSAIDNSINTIDKLFKNPAWKDVVGSFEGRMPESASMMDDKESDAIALINTLGSQVFMSAVKDAGSMTGLTEKEGEKLQNSLAALGRAQSEKAFEGNLREAQRLLMKSRQGLSARYGVPDSSPDIEAIRSPANDMPPPGAVRLKGK
jgi:hypothetical protein